MSDPTTKKPVAIPDWQKNYIGSTTADDPKTESSPEVSAEKSRDQLVEDARRFLADESIRDASRERKVAYLEKKGIQGDEIQKLLEEEEIPEIKTVHDSTTTTLKSPASAQEPSRSTSIPPPSTITTTRDIPPIITYPEFLLRPTKPPPLVTARRLATALYALAGVATLTYGASKYLVQPMLENLTSARHELADTALVGLEKLNKKIEGTVSHVPVLASMKKKIAQDDEDKDSDADSTTSDPTELFHRDVATQTSPPHSRRDSFGAISLSAPHTSTTANTTTQQASQLSSLCATLRSLESSTTTSYSADALGESVKELQELIDTVQMRHNAYHTGDYSHIYPTTGGGEKKKGPAEGSEAAKFKAEIRALKGALLGARSFPVARPATTGFGGSSVGVR